MKKIQRTPVLEPQLTISPACLFSSPKQLTLVSSSSRTILWIHVLAHPAQAIAKYGNERKLRKDGIFPVCARAYRNNLFYGKLDCDNEDLNVGNDPGRGSDDLCLRNV